MRKLSVCISKNLRLLNVRSNTRPVSGLYDFQFSSLNTVLPLPLLFTYLRLSKQVSHIFAQILNLIETMFFCEHWKEYRNFTQSLGAGILHTVPPYIRGQIFQKILASGVSNIPLHESEDKDGEIDF